MTEVVLEDNPQALRTVYPCKVTVEGDVLTVFGKAVVTAAAVYVFTAGEGGNGIAQRLAALTVTQDLAPRWQGSGAVSTLHLADGRTVVLKHLGGCGCSSGALKRFRPFT